jgi:hypothetical protein
LLALNLRYSGKNDFCNLFWKAKNPTGLFIVYLTRQLDKTFCSFFRLELRLMVGSDSDILIGYRWDINPESIWIQ